MSKHFLKGTHSAYTDTGPGTIVVDLGANIFAGGTNEAGLSLASGPWTVKFNGSILAADGQGIDLKDTGTFVSTVTIGDKSGIVANHAFGIGVNASHRANITNAGHITAHLAGIAETGDGNFRIENAKTGKIVSDLLGIDIESLGTHRIINAGTVESEYAVRSHAGIETVTNTGTLIGKVDLGEGNDIFSNFRKVAGIVRSGSVTGSIDLGAGDDIFNGGNRSEIVKDGDGKDVIKLVGGNDHWIADFSSAGDGVDVINGGKGIDEYDASASGANGVAINLDSRDHFVFEAGTVSAVGAAVETIRNFENAIGTSESDTIIGSNGANLIFGLGGGDWIYGLGGKDALIGGDGEDSFVFLSLRDSGPTKASRDVISGFEGAGIAGGDTIDLSILSSKLGLVMDFLGTDVAFNGNAGAIRATWVGNQTIVQLDANGDRKADFSIALDGQHTLASSDFILEL